MVSADTIVAISSAVGTPAFPAARMIVRASGPEAHAAAAAVCPGVVLRGGKVSSAALRLESLHGCGVSIHIYCFAAPHSYTGQDMTEFHLPGSPLLAKLLLDELIARGCRLADPGEFTARAYFTGRIDLTEAEGVAATIAAAGEAELRGARQLLSGELARRLRPVMDLLAGTLALVEVGIDFSEEDVTFLAPAELATRLSRATASLDKIVEESSRFDRLTHEPRAVLVGRPNAGKSTLLNVLAGRQRAIVSPIAGTTRDALSAEVMLPRGPLKLIDIAGLEDDLTCHAGLKPPSSPARDRVPNEISHQMHQRALDEIRTADFVLLLHDRTSPDPPLDLTSLLGRPSDQVVFTKADLAAAVIPAALPQAITVSAITGDGIDLLFARLDTIAFGQTAAAVSSLALNSRHLSAIGQSLDALHRAASLASGANPGLELLALELREALDALGGILGSVSTEELLGRIFSAFCIGK